MFQTVSHTNLVRSICRDEVKQTVLKGLKCLSIVNKIVLCVGDQWQSLREEATLTSDMWISSYTVAESVQRSIC